MRVSVDVDVDPEDVLNELSDQELAQVLAKRTKHTTEEPNVLLQRVYEHFSLAGNAPRCLSDYIWSVMGRVV